jgi:hypothetical protein
MLLIFTSWIRGVFSRGWLYGSPPPLIRTARRQFDDRLVSRGPPPLLTFSTLHAYPAYHRLRSLAHLTFIFARARKHHVSLPAQGPPRDSVQSSHANTTASPRGDTGSDRSRRRGSLRAKAAAKADDAAEHDVRPLSGRSEPTVRSPISLPSLRNLSSTSQLGSRPDTGSRSSSRPHRSTRSLDPTPWVCGVKPFVPVTPRSFSATAANRSRWPAARLRGSPDFQTSEKGARSGSTNSADFVYPHG